MIEFEKPKYEAYAGSPWQKANAIREQHFLPMPVAERIFHEIVSAANREIEIARKRQVVFEALCHEFIARVECGEVRSRFTYMRAKAALGNASTFAYASLKAELEKKASEEVESLNKQKAHLLSELEKTAAVAQDRQEMIDDLKEKIRALEADNKRLEEGRDELQKTLSAVETEVAKVYTHITDSAISKCNTDAATVIAVSDDVHSRLVAEEVNAEVAKAFQPIEEFLSFDSGRQVTLRSTGSGFECELSALVAETPDGSAQYLGEVAEEEGATVGDAIREAFANIDWHGSEAWNVPPKPEPVSVTPAAQPLGAEEIDCPF